MLKLIYPISLDFKPLIKWEDGYYCVVFYEV